MSDGSIIIDVELDKTEFEKQVADLSSVSKQATLAFAGAAAGAVAISTAIWETASAAAEAGDRIDKMSQRVGLSREKFQEWDYILAQNGGNIESLQMGIKSLTDKIDLALTGNESAIKSFGSLGISLDDLKGKTREQIFESVIKGLQGTTDEQKRAAIGADLLSRAYIDLAPTLGQTAEQTEALRQRAHDLNLIVGDEAIDSGVKFGDTLDDLKKVVGQVAATIGTEFIPALTRLMEWVATFVGNKTRMDEMVELFKLTLTVIAAASAGLAAYGVAMLVLNANLIIATASQIALNFAMSLNPIAAVIALVVALGVGLLALSGTMGDFVGAMGGFFADLTLVASECFTGITNWLLENVPEALNSCLISFQNFQTSLSIVFAAISESITALSATMKAWAEGFKTSVKLVMDYLGTIPAMITSVMSAAWDAFVNGATSLMAKVESVMIQLTQTIISAIAALPAQMFNYGVQMVTSLWNGLRSQMDALINYLRQKMAEIAAILSGGSGTETTSVSSLSSASVRSLSPSFATLSAGSNIVFNQTINSPIALSPAEIAREAENSMTFWGIK